MSLECVDKGSMHVQYCSNAPRENSVLSSRKIFCEIYCSTELRNFLGHFEHCSQFSTHKICSDWSLTLIWMAFKKMCCRAAGNHIWLPGDQYEAGKALRESPPPVCTPVGRLGVIYDSQAVRNAQKHHYKQVEALTFYGKIATTTNRWKLLLFNRKIALNHI